MPPFLSDEHAQPYEDAADRKERAHPRTVGRELQAMAKHSWEDAKRRTLEKRALVLLEQVSKPGTHHLDRTCFETLVSWLFWDQDKERRKVERSGRLDLKTSLVLRLLPGGYGAGTKREAA